ncbi:hypothetical protein KGF56_002886 [Candida oxycetoniae]|uniref:Uncharacterized protein n=1 Tax=Candida oxycetoniae TaxID=497107 RepID=A0AAI9WY17_9ASCO|nr:uncharacterized protein KGF56_002886 [Candida oxycetoniae]KAI3404365.2 hypothetical protein KGF56_002886 [Candida oxycetoniae]
MARPADLPLRDSVVELSSAEPTTKTKLSEQLQILQQQNNILIKRNHIFSSKIAHLENKVNLLNEEICKKSKSSDDKVLRIVEMMEESLLNSFSASLTHFQQLRCKNKFSQNALLGKLHDIIRESLTTTPTENSHGSSVITQSQNFKPHAIRKNGSEIPQFFKKSGVNYLSEKFSTILEHSSDSEEDMFDLRQIGPFVVDRENPDTPHHEQVAETHEQLDETHEQLDETHEQVAETHEQIDETHEQVADTHEQLDETHEQLDEESKSDANRDNLLTIEANNDSKEKNTPTTKCDQEESAVSNLPHCDTSKVNSAVSNVSDNDSESFLQRTTRAKKEVSYKPLSLRAKMRRDSAQLMDAVGENVYVNHTVQSHSQENQLDKRPVKRKPLENVTNNLNSKRCKKSTITTTTTTTTDEDLSIFDFDSGTKPKRKSKKKIKP